MLEFLDFLLLGIFALIYLFFLIDGEKENQEKEAEKQPLIENEVSAPLEAVVEAVVTEVPVIVAPEEEKPIVEIVKEEVVLPIPEPEKEKQKLIKDEDLFKFVEEEDRPFIYTLIEQLEDASMVRIIVSKATSKDLALTTHWKAGPPTYYEKDFFDVTINNMRKKTFRALLFKTTHLIIVGFNDSTYHHLTSALDLLDSDDDVEKSFISIVISANSVRLSPQYLHLLSSCDSSEISISAQKVDCSESNITKFMRNSSVKNARYLKWTPHYKYNPNDDNHDEPEASLANPADRKIHALFKLEFKQLIQSRLATEQEKIDISLPLTHGLLNEVEILEGIPHEILDKTKGYWKAKCTNEDYSIIVQSFTDHCSVRCEL